MQRFIFRVWADGELIAHSIVPKRCGDDAAVVLQVCQLAINRSCEIRLYRREWEDHQNITIEFLRRLPWSANFRL